MKIDVLAAMGDNYIYVAHAGGHALVVDPGIAKPVLTRLDRAVVKAVTILLTHHHGDHTGGCEALRREAGAAVVGPVDRRLPRLDKQVDGGPVDLSGWSVDALPVPGHTRSHVAYHFPEHAVVFTGDALFVGGCGRVLEGTPAEMWDSLCRLRDLPDATAVYCGHDYTVENLEFAQHLLPGDAHVATALEQARTRAARGEPTVPSTIASERRINIFLRSDDPVVAPAVGLSAGTPAPRVFAELRRRKDAW
jgi:hydroxyacylglutathione hydrolase